APLAELLARLPAERMRAKPELAAVAALSRLAVGELEEADAWLELAETGAPAPGSALPLARLGRARLGGAELWDGQREEAAGHLEQAVADAGRTGRELLELDATAHLAVLEALRGNLGRAVELGRLALAA